jgi:uncharacterized LabA/DUF88 family protein
VPDDRAVTNDEGPLEATLVFREQSDGRKVARLPGGKVVLVHWDHIERIRDGECWHVKLVHRETYTVAMPVEKARPELAPSVLSSLGAALAKAVQMPNPNVAPPAATRIPAPPPTPSAPVANSPVSRTEPRPLAIQPSRVVGQNDRIAMFVDGANMDQACRSAGYFIDYRRARNFFLAHGLFYAAYYYIADYTASDPQQTRYLDFLAHSDFIVRRKAVKVIRDSETGERVLKANVDTELILDLINTADNYDLAFLFSGDSDFERAVDLLRSRGKRVYVVTARAVMSRELSYVADKPVFFIEEFRAQLERDPKPETKRET